MEKPSVASQLRDFRAKIPSEILSRYERPCPGLALRQIATDWTLAVLAWQVYVRAPSLTTLAVGVLMMGYVQRGLSNLLHDCAHFNIFAKPAYNYIAGDLFLAPGLMTSVKQYRNSHTDHHHHLGGKDDPDHGEGNLTSLRHYRNCRFDHTSFWSLFAYDLLDARSFYQTAVGSAPDMSPGQLARFLAWWGTVSVLTGVLGEGRYLGLSFLLLWHAARLTVAHACFIFRELLDHSGLASTSVLSFTRTLPCCNLLQKFLQPHDDNYHLLHHLFPRVPMARAHEMHLWLLDNVEAYRKTNRFEIYFGGKEALFESSLHAYSNQGQHQRQSNPDADRKAVRI